MIYISQICVAGKAEAGSFEGVMNLHEGLQIVAADNGFGKSLAARAIAWSVGAEVLFGRPDDDPTFFSHAVLDHLDLPQAKKTRVIASECSITLRRSTTGESIVLTRDILGGERGVVRLTEISPRGESRHSTLLARQGTMKEEHAGLQRFLFDWFGWPRKRVATYQGPPSDIYLENLLPLFYIEQKHGWTGVQRTQVTRYRQQQIREAALEFHLGAENAIDIRLAKNLAAQREAALRDSARLLATRVNAVIGRHGWTAEWSAEGTIAHIEARWARRPIREELLSSANVDLAKEMEILRARVSALQTRLTSGSIDANNISAPAGASQQVIELKQRRHEINAELGGLRLQAMQSSDLLTSIEHRLKSAEDVRRMKSTGVGRLTYAECPTCHHELDPSLFELASHAVDSISTHIDALKRDREMMRKNRDGIVAAISRVDAEARETDVRFRDAERALLMVNEAVGTVREQIAAIASELTSAQRALDRLSDTASEIGTLQIEVDDWLGEVRRVRAAIESTPADLDERLIALRRNLQQYLLKLGHEAVTIHNVETLRLDESYEPLLDGKSLLHLGAGSDVARMVAAYSLALAAASSEVGGHHPGFVVMDEPLQQNPDKKHRDLFVKTLREDLSQASGFQTLIFTYLMPHEIAELQAAGVRLVDVTPPKFLAPPPPPRAAARDSSK